MRTISAATQAVLDSDNVKIIFLMELQFSSTYRFTSYHSNIVYDGNTYLSDGGMFEFDSPKFSSVVDRESYKIVIADQAALMLAEFRANVIGKPISVKVALLDVNGDPMLGVDDVISVYNGFVDSPSISNDFEQKLAIIEGTSPMSDLDMVRSFMTSKAGMDQHSATDTSFDEIYDNKQTTVKWGKV
jgi:hypothetical protein